MAPHITAARLPDLGQPFDVAVVGAGTIGLVAAIALAQAGFSVCLIGDATPARPGRTVALLDGSVRFLDRLGLWVGLKPLAAPLRVMRIVDATPSLFRAPPVSFRADEIGLPCFGFNIANGDLDDALSEAAHTTSNLTRVGGSASHAASSATGVTIGTEAGPAIVAALAIGADGRRSLIRRAAHIGVRTETHPQVALTGLFTHGAPHEGISTEFHTRQGPFTLVPLPDAADGSHRSSLVWVMSPTEAARRRGLAPAAFAREAERQCARLLGAMTPVSAVGSFPIVTSVSTRVTTDRVALIGEAAHALPPIGAQGLNLSIRDVEALIETLTEADRHREDIGGRAVLDRFARRRRSDVAVRTMAVGLLNGSLLSASIGSDILRGAGLTALATIGPMRRFAMRHGLVPNGRAQVAESEPRLDAAERYRPSSPPLSSASARMPEP